MTTGQEIYDTLPESDQVARDKMILDAVDGGQLTFDWVDITSSTADGNHTATFSILSDAAYLSLDNGSRFRPASCAKTLQMIADKVSASLITAKILDLRHAQAPTKLDATILPAAPAMIGTAYSKMWNTKLEAKRGDLTYISCIGKPFILDNSLGTGMGAVLYGFYSKSGPDISKNGYHMWQSISDRHLPTYQDYSSTIILMKSDCQVDGNCMNVADVMKDPVLCELICYGGVLKYQRQPGV